MKDSRVRFTVYVAFLTAGVALMLTGISGSLLLGVVFVLLSSFSSQRQIRNKPERLIALLVCLIAALVDFSHNWRHGNILKREPVEIWFWVLLIGAWLWSIIDEFRLRRTSRIIKNAA